MGYPLLTLCAARYGFAADLRSALAIKNQNANVVTNWYTTTVAGLFDRGNVFNEAAGVFVAPVTGAVRYLRQPREVLTCCLGYYFANANVRIDQVSTAT